MENIYDVAIIGGGINGCGCAADAALRGLSVVLLEQNDLASKTSSSSTKLIHGGLRYLEYYEFGLVKKSLAERQLLLDLAPHLVHPQLFILPYQKHMRPSWFLRLGLFFYDHLSWKNKLPHCKKISRSIKNTFFNPLMKYLTHGFIFYDGATDDSRLTITNAIQAKLNGADIRTQSQVLKAEYINNLWHITIQPQKGSSYVLFAKAMINAAGPWVENIAQLTNTSINQKTTLVKGSHILIPPLYEGSQAYFLQHKDNRVVFVIPYHGFTMIGTTDVAFNEKLDDLHISDEEVNYLINLVNEYFTTKVAPTDITFTWSGVRTLLAADDKEAKSLSRDYSYEFKKLKPPIVTLFGGKITTYRQLSEEVINQLSFVFPDLPSSPTKHMALPGSLFGKMDFKNYCIYAAKKYNWLNAELLNRYLYSYGSRLEIILKECNTIDSLGEYFGSSLYQVEVDYLIIEEWAKEVDDILYRRTKLGLTMDNKNKQNLAEYLARINVCPLLPESELEFH
ncbi:MAG: glycerol-3-phosphate dehydrogenase [bacterium]|nr:glycerol-3-phosphate dehydrogenase [bacterium]